MPDATSGGFAGPAAALSKPSTSKGMHGFFLAAANMRSTFMLMGRGVPAGRSLGEVDMRAIAPTLAAILEVPFASAEVAPVALGN